MNQGYEKFFKQAKEVRQPKQPQFKIKPTTPNKNAQKKTPDHHSQIDEHFESTGHHLSPEQKLKIKFMERKRQLNKNSKRVKPPYVTMICILSSAVFVTLGYFNYQKVNFILKHIEIQLNDAQAAGETPKAEPKPDSKPDTKKEAVLPAGAVASAAKSADPSLIQQEKKSQTGTDKTKSEVPDLRTMTKEELSYFSHLVDRKKELDQRETELSKLDEELQKQRVELDQKIQKLEKMRTEISGILKDRVQVDQEKVEKLVQFYSSMKAQQAARVLENLNEELAVEVLDKMKKKSAAEIMNSLDPKKAKKLSEMLAGYRKPASEDDNKR